MTAAKFPTLWKRKSAWRIEPADLPSEKALLAQPRLQGLKDNPAFRILLFNHYRGKWRGFGSLTSLAASTRWAWLLVLSFYLPLILLVILGLWIYRHRQLSTRGPWISSLTANVAADLHHAGVPSVQIAIAVWGSRVSRREQELGQWSAVICFLVGLCTLLIFPHWAFPDSYWRHLGLFILGMSGSVYASQLYFPFPGVLKAFREVHGQRKRIDSIVSRRILQLFMLVILLPLWGFVPYVLGRTVPRMMQGLMAVITVMSKFPLPIQMVIWLLAGMVLGLAHGYYSRRFWEGHLERLRVDVEILMEEARNVIHERVAPG